MARIQGETYMVPALRQVPTFAAQDTGETFQNICVVTPKISNMKFFLYQNSLINLLRVYQELHNLSLGNRWVLNLSITSTKQICAVGIDLLIYILWKL